MAATADIGLVGLADGGWSRTAAPLTAHAEPANATLGRCAGHYGTADTG